MEPSMAKAKVWKETLNGKVQGDLLGYCYSFFLSSKHRRCGKDNGLMGAL